MEYCPHIIACVFFRDEMGDKPGIVIESFKLRFCKGTYANCARWQVSSALGSNFVPRDLYPNQEERVADILKKHKEE